MTECTSTRGQWSVPGQKPNRCPACKAEMPYDRGALRSDHAMKSIDQARSEYGRTADPEARWWGYKQQKKAA